MKLVCQYCQKEFNADSSTRKYCSTECRLAALRKSPEGSSDYGKYYNKEGLETDSEGKPIFLEPTSLKQYIELWLRSNPDRHEELKRNYEKKYPMPDFDTPEWHLWLSERHEAIISALMEVKEARADWEKIVRERRKHAKESTF